MFILTMHTERENGRKRLRIYSTLEQNENNTNTQKLLRVLSKHRLSLASLYFSSILAIEITANVKGNGHE